MEIVELNEFDAKWTAIAQHLGAAWSWTRQLDERDQPARTHGWLRGPDGACLSVWPTTNVRWEIRAIPDMRVPETGEPIYVEDLYRANERKPLRAFTIAQARSTEVIAREIQRRLLPAMQEISRRSRERIRQRSALYARRERAVEAFQRLYSDLHRNAWSRGGAPLVSFAPAISLDLRIEDEDCIVVTQWSDLDLATTMRVVTLVLELRSHSTEGRQS